MAHEHQPDTSGIRPVMPDFSGNERRTRWVVLITLLTMFAELLVGYWSNSMSLTADGWHMGTHAGALGLVLLGYWYARSRIDDPRYNFGTGKVFALNAFASAIILALVSGHIIFESTQRILNPLDINFDQALPVAVIGLIVNVVCAFILQRDEVAEAVADQHNQGHDHHHHHHHHHHHSGGGDHNLRAAYLHVIADALTSLAAIMALIAGRWLDWGVLDAVVGVVGGLVIVRWAWVLARDSARDLLDVVPDADHIQRLKACVEKEPETKVVNLLLWNIGPGQQACVVTLVAAAPQPIAHYRRLIRSQTHLAMVVVQVESKNSSV